MSAKLARNDGATACVVNHRYDNSVAAAGITADPPGDSDPQDGYGTIWQVRAWNDVGGTLTAYDLIGAVAANGEILPLTVTPAGHRPAVGRDVDLAAIAASQPPP